MVRLLISAVMFLLAAVQAAADDGLWRKFVCPDDASRTKVWWFHGETETTREGIDADLEAFRRKGVGGVVFYDQVHGRCEGALPSMSPEWWQMLKYAALKARSLGLTFEVAASNGYVTGGPWITPELGMRKLAVADTVITTDRRREVTVSLAGSSGFAGVATVIFPDEDKFQDIPVGHGRVTLTGNATAVIDFDAGRMMDVAAVSYEVNPRGKGSTGSMNIPGDPQERYFGAGYVELPPIGDFEYSADGLGWKSAVQLPAVESVIGHKTKERTVSFPAVRGRYFRVRLHDWADAEGRFDKLVVENVRLSRRDRVDNWQVKTGLRTEVMYPRAAGGNTGALNPDDVRDISRFTSSDGVVRLTLEPGTWHIMRFGHVPTGSRTKHGRKNLLGPEAGVMSAEAARVHFDNYFRRICDTLSAIGCKPAGMCMDSHEAGIQNWTEGFEARFRAARGYDITPWLPALAGYIVGDRDRAEHVLLDFRKTIAETISTEYYGTLASLCRESGVDFTCQAMLNIDNDNILSRSAATKPQGEFWAYQTDGNYDCLDAASAAHLYGRGIASGEAFTDTPYGRSWDELLRIANLAYCRGINEFAVCASSYQPWTDRRYDDSQSAHPYIFHRMNPDWESSGPFWDYQARCAQLLREGSPVVDLCVYIGEDVPLKTFAYKLPVIPEGYNFDVCTYNALMHRFGAAGGELAVEGGMRYKALVVQDRTYISAEARCRIEELERAGVPVIWCDRGEDVADRLRHFGISPDISVRSAARPDDRICFFHRRTGSADIYFVYNHSARGYDAPVRLRTIYDNVELWNPYSVGRTAVESAGDKTVRLALGPYQSVFLVCY